MSSVWDLTGSVVVWNRMQQCRPAAALRLTKRWPGRTGHQMGTNVTPNLQHCQLDVSTERG